jgi:hypothetical protein
MKSTEFKANAFVWPFWPSMMAIIGLAMNGMYFMFFLGLPTLLTVLLFIGLIYLGVGLLAGEAVYTVSENGLDQHIGSMSWIKFARKNINRHFSWEDILWYKQGSELSRSLAEFQYLTIKLKKWPYSLQLNNKKADPTSFATFVINFMLNAELYNSGGKASDKPIAVRISEPPKAKVHINQPKHLIETKPDFYKTTKARVIFWVFTFVFIALIGAMYATGIFKWSYAYRFLFVIIPGMAYMYFRIYVKK